MNIERFRFQMFVHPTFLCTNVRFGLHFVDHQVSFDREVTDTQIKKPESLPASASTFARFASSYFW
jgi:hypothetical protein